MEGAFQAHTLTSSFSQDLPFKSSIFESNYRTPDLGSDQSITKTEPTVYTNSAQKPSEPPKFYFNVSDLSSKPYLEVNQPNQNNNSSQYQFNFLSGLDKFKKQLLSPRDGSEGTMLIPDEKKDLMDLTAYSAAEEWRPSAAPKREKANKSPSPIATRAGGNTTSRSNITQTPTPNFSAKRKQLEKQNSSRNESTSRNGSPSRDGSPSRRLNRYGSSERYFETMTGKIFEAANNQSILSRKSSVPNMTSPQKANRSSVLNTSTHSICYSPLKKSAKLTTLKSIKLNGSPNVEGKTKTGLEAVRGALDETIAERDEMKDIVEKLKQAIREEKASLEKTQENIRLLANHSHCLSKRSGNLDQNTINVQGLMYRTREEVAKLETEIAFCSGMVMRINKQVEIEKELINLNEENIKALRVQIAQDSKERDDVRTRAEVSRHDRKKSVEKYQNATNTQKNIIVTLEDNFRRYAG